MANYMVGITYEEYKDITKPDELFMFVYYGISGWELDEEKYIECKCRLAPRKFESFYMVKPEKARLVYWNSEIGLRIKKIELKEKSGLIRIDKDEIIESALADFRNNPGKKKTLTKGDSDMLEAIKHYITLTENAFHKGYSEYYFDWHTYIYRNHYLKGVLRIGGYDVKSILLDTHNPNKEYSWIKEHVNVEGGNIELEELNAWIERFRDYSAKLIIVYYDGEDIKVSQVEWKGAFGDEPDRRIREGDLFK